MKDNFDQHAGHRPRSSTGWRHAAHSGGKARSSAARNAARTALAARFVDWDMALASENVMVQRYRRAIRMSPARAAAP